MLISSRRKFLQISAGIAAAAASGRAVGALHEMDQSPQEEPSPAPIFLWLPAPSRPLDVYGAFRGAFHLEKESDLTVEIFGAHWFHAWMDGRFLTEGPARFEAAHPEYEVLRLRCGAGSHCLSALVHHEGVSTRLLRGDVLPPFLYARVTAEGREIPVTWKCRELEAFHATNVRTSLQLGWIEWCDMAKLPRDWKRVEFRDTGWAAPRPVQPALGAMRPLSIGTVHLVSGRPALLARGRYAGPVRLHTGTAGEDIPIGLARRNLEPGEGDSHGVWRRYDLGQVRLGRPVFTLDLPPGANVDFVYAESLSRGSVSPLIPLSCGPSCNFDHYTASGGAEEFAPLTPRGCRYMEVHVSGPEDKIRFVREEFVERTYFDRFGGSFSCDDDLLNRVWALGPATLRACTEDAVTDNPTRERGQWTGDVVSVGSEIMSVLSGDLRLIRRGLLQSAWCATEDGIVAGLSPGGSTHVSTYALQWVSAVVHYYRLTGDRSLLEELYEHARRNLEAFEKHRVDEVIGNVPGTWAFVDWGYVAPPTGPDAALNLHYALALRDMAAWSEQIRPAAAERYAAQAVRTLDKLRPSFADVTSAGDFERLGYHATALGFHADLWSPEQQRPAVQAMKRHIERCFPNDPSAPRLSDPTVRERRLISPYFAHYAFPPLIRHGEMDFVLDQYRKCWGWALEQGCTTMLEVFDTGWSHCHQWSCCPTWQLSRYVLGLHPRTDLGEAHFLLDLRRGSLKRAEGTLPIPGTDHLVAIRWETAGDAVRYELKSPVALVLVNAAGEPLHRLAAGTWQTVAV